MIYYLVALQIDMSSLLTDCHSPNSLKNCYNSDFLKLFLPFFNRSITNLSFLLEMEYEFQKCLKDIKYKMIILIKEYFHRVILNLPHKESVDPYPSHLTAANDNSSTDYITNDNTLSLIQDLINLSLSIDEISINKTTPVSIYKHQHPQRLNSEIKLVLGNLPNAKLIKNTAGNSSKSNSVDEYNTLDDSFDLVKDSMNKIDNTPVTKVKQKEITLIYELFGTPTNCVDKLHLCQYVPVMRQTDIVGQVKQISGLLIVYAISLIIQNNMSWSTFYFNKSEIMNSNRVDTSSKNFNDVISVFSPELFNELLVLFDKFYFRLTNDSSLNVNLNSWLWSTNRIHCKFLFSLLSYFQLNRHSPQGCMSMWDNNLETVTYQDLLPIYYLKRLIPLLHNLKKFAYFSSVELSIDLIASCNPNNVNHIILLCVVLTQLSKCHYLGFHIKRLIMVVIIKTFSHLTAFGFTLSPIKELKTLSINLYKEYVFQWLKYKKKYLSLAAPAAVILLCLTNSTFFIENFEPLLKLLFKLLRTEKRYKQSVILSISHLLGFYFTWFYNVNKDLDTELIHSDHNQMVFKILENHLNVLNQNILSTESEVVLPFYINLFTIICLKSPENGIPFLVNLIPVKSQDIMIESTPIILMTFIALYEYQSYILDKYSNLPKLNNPVYMPFWPYPTIYINLLSCLNENGSTPVSYLNTCLMHSPYHVFIYSSVLQSMMNYDSHISSNKDPFFFVEINTHELNIHLKRNNNRNKALINYLDKFNHIIEQFSLVIIGYTEKEVALSYHKWKATNKVSTNEITLISKNEYPLHILRCIGITLIKYFKPHINLILNFPSLVYSQTYIVQQTTLRLLLPSIVSSPANFQTWNMIWLQLTIFLIDNFIKNENAVITALIIIQFLLTLYLQQIDHLILHWSDSSSPSSIKIYRNLFYATDTIYNDYIKLEKLNSDNTTDKFTNSTKSKKNTYNINVKTSFMKETKNTNNYSKIISEYENLHVKYTMLCGLFKDIKCTFAKKPSQLYKVLNENIGQLSFSLLDLLQTICVLCIASVSVEIRAIACHILKQCYCIHNKFVFYSKNRVSLDKSEFCIDDAKFIYQWLNLRETTLISIFKNELKHIFQFYADLPSITKYYSKIGSCIYSKDIEQFSLNYTLQDEKSLNCNTRTNKYELGKSIDYKFIEIHELIEKITFKSPSLYVYETITIEKDTYISINNRICEFYSSIFIETTESSNNSIWSYVLKCTTSQLLVLISIIVSDLLTFHINCSYFMSFISFYALFLSVDQNNAFITNISLLNSSFLPEIEQWKILYAISFITNISNKNAMINAHMHELPKKQLYHDITTNDNSFQDNLAQEKIVHGRKEIPITSIQNCQYTKSLNYLKQVDTAHELKVNNKYQQNSNLLSTRKNNSWKRFEDIIQLIYFISSNVKYNIIQDFFDLFLFIIDFCTIYFYKNAIPIAPYVPSLTTNIIENMYQKIFSVTQQKQKDQQIQLSSSLLLTAMCTLSSIYYSQYTDGSLNITETTPTVQNIGAIQLLNIFNDIFHSLVFSHVQVAHSPTQQNLSVRKHWASNSLLSIPVNYSISRHCKTFSDGQSNASKSSEYSESSRLYKQKQVWSHKILLGDSFINFKEDRGLCVYEKILSARILASITNFFKIVVNKSHQYGAQLIPLIDNWIDFTCICICRVLTPFTEHLYSPHRQCNALNLNSVQKMNYVSTVDFVLNNKTKIEILNNSDLLKKLKFEFIKDVLYSWNHTPNHHSFDQVKCTHPFFNLSHHLSILHILVNKTVEFSIYKSKSKIPEYTEHVISLYRSLSAILNNFIMPSIFKDLFKHVNYGEDRLNINDPYCIMLTYYIDILKEACISNNNKQLSLPINTLASSIIYIFASYPSWYIHQIIEELQNETLMSYNLLLSTYILLKSAEVYNEQHSTVVPLHNYECFFNVGANDSLIPNIITICYTYLSYTNQWSECMQGTITALASIMHHFLNTLCECGSLSVKYSENEWMEVLSSCKYLKTKNRNEESMYHTMFYVVEKYLIGHHLQLDIEYILLSLLNYLIPLITTTTHVIEFLTQLTIDYIYLTECFDRTLQHKYLSTMHHKNIATSFISNKLSHIWNSISKSLPVYLQKWVDYIFENMSIQTFDLIFPLLCPSEFSCSNELAIAYQTNSLQSLTLRVNPPRILCLLIISSITTLLYNYIGNTHEATHNAEISDINQAHFINSLHSVNNPLLDIYLSNAKSQLTLLNLNFIANNNTNKFIMSWLKSSLISILTLIKSFNLIFYPGFTERSSTLSNNGCLSLHTNKVSNEQAPSMFNAILDNIFTFGDFNMDISLEKDIHTKKETVINLDEINSNIPQFIPTHRINKACIKSRLHILISLLVNIIQHYIFFCIRFQCIDRSMYVTNSHKSIMEIYYTILLESIHILPSICIMICYYYSEYTEATITLKEANCFTHPLLNVLDFYLCDTLKENYDNIDILTLNAGTHLFQYIYLFLPRPLYCGIIKSNIILQLHSLIVDHETNSNNTKHQVLLLNYLDMFYFCLNVDKYIYSENETINNLILFIKIIYSYMLEETNSTSIQIRVLQCLIICFHDNKLITNAIIRSNIQINNIINVLFLILIQMIHSDNNFSEHIFILFCTLIEIFKKHKFHISNEINTISSLNHSIKLNSGELYSKNQDEISENSTFVDHLLDILKYCSIQDVTCFVLCSNLFKLNAEEINIQSKVNYSIYILLYSSSNILNQLSFLIALWSCLNNIQISNHSSSYTSEFNNEYYSLYNQYLQSFTINETLNYNHNTIEIACRKYMENEGSSGSFFVIRFLVIQIQLVLAHDLRTGLKHCCLSYLLYILNIFLQYLVTNKNLEFTRSIINDYSYMLSNIKKIHLDSISKHCINSMTVTLNKNISEHIKSETPLIKRYYLLVASYSVTKRNCMILDYIVSFLNNNKENLKYIFKTTHMYYNVNNTNKISKEIYKTLTILEKRNKSLPNDNPFVLTSSQPYIYTTNVTSQRHFIMNSNLKEQFS